jgi:peroxiredoxin
MKVVSSLLLFLAALPALAGEKASPVGKKVENFTLRDYRGAERSLAEFAEKKLVVVAFVGCGCPVARLYGLRLVELAKEYEPKGVAFLAVNSNQQDSLRDLDKFAREYKVPFPILKDTGNTLADRLGAVHVPEVFVLDAGRTVRYQGRIDDQYGVGYARPKPEHRDLADALDALLDGKAVPTPVTEVSGCIIGRVQRADGRAEVTYTKHIAPILQQRCVGCHQPGEVAPFSLTSYDDAAGWAPTMRRVIKQERMPPWHADAKPGQFRNDTRMPEEERQLLYRWIDGGAPEGDPKDLPRPIERAEGWRIPKPDVVLSMPRPFKVPATGTVVYQYFVVDTGFTEDKWVRAAEIRPGNRAVVHHTIVHVQPPDGPPVMNNGLASHWLAAQAPGSHPTLLADGLAKRIPAGSRLLFQMHYTPNGVETEDRTCIALTFADPKSVKKEVITEMAANNRFAIPPNAPKHVVEADYPVREDSLLLQFMPHTHLRGSYFRYEAHYPDGRQETLLDVPRYDFNWQNTYILAEPKTLPKGTRIHCVAHYNNSKSNYSNPDPSQTVRWGDQTWEEMMIGYFDLTPVGQDLLKNPSPPRAFRLPEIDPELRALAGKALSSPEAFEAFAAALKKAYPQVDRVDVTRVQNDKLQVVQASYLGDAGQQFARAGFEAPVRACMLGGVALLNRYEAFPSLEKARGMDLNLMFKTAKMQSSLHAPVALDGAPGSVNFWSKQPGAFDKEKHRALRAVAQAVVAGRQPEAPR